MHASYNAQRDLNFFIQEKQKLELVSNYNVKGLRHHYWHMTRNEDQTLKMHESSGFEYDSSMAFNDGLGFRKNIAYAFFPWNKEAIRRLDTLQLPVFCMDGNLFYGDINCEDAVATIKTYIELIKSYEGVGIIDWHVRSSYPKNAEYSEWGKAYVKIIEYLASDSEIWTTNLYAIASWLIKQEKKVPQKHAGRGTSGL